MNTQTLNGIKFRRKKNINDVKFINGAKTLPSASDLHLSEAAEAIAGQMDSAIAHIYSRGEQSNRGNLLSVGVHCRGQQRVAFKAIGPEPEPTSSCFSERGPQPAWESVPGKVSPSSGGQVGKARNNWRPALQIIKERGAKSLASPLG